MPEDGTQYVESDWLDGDLNEQLSDDVEDPTHPRDLGKSLGGPTSIDPVVSPNAPSSPAYRIQWPEKPISIIEQASDRFYVSRYVVKDGKAPILIAQRRRARVRIRIKVQWTGLLRQIYFGPTQTVSADNGWYLANQLDGEASGLERYDNGMELRTTAEIWAVCVTGGGDANVQVLEEWND